MKPAYILLWDSYEKAVTNSEASETSGMECALWNTEDKVTPTVPKFNFIVVH